MTARGRCKRRGVRGNGRSRWWRHWRGRRLRHRCWRSRGARVPAKGVLLRRRCRGRGWPARDTCPGRTAACSGSSGSRGPRGRTAAASGDTCAAARARRRGRSSSSGRARGSVVFRSVHAGNIVGCLHQVEEDCLRQGLLLPRELVPCGGFPPQAQQALTGAVHRATHDHLHAGPQRQMQVMRALVVPDGAAEFVEHGRVQPLLQFVPPHRDHQRMANRQTLDAVDVRVVLLCTRPARGRVSRVLLQSRLTRSPHRSDVCNRHEERGHPPFLLDPAILTLRCVVLPLPLLRLVRPRPRCALHPSRSTDGEQSPPPGPLVSGQPVDGGVVIRARGSGAPAGAPPHGKLTRVAPRRSSAPGAHWSRKGCE